VRFDVRGIDHLRVRGSSVPGEFPKQVFPDAAPSPAHKAVIDRCRRTILRRAIAPATAALQYMHDAADDSAIVRPLHAPYIRRQVTLNPLPLLIAQPKQVPAHDPDPPPKTNQDRIVREEKLMSSDPKVDLIRAGLATAKTERMVAGGRPMEVARVRITGRRPAVARRACQVVRAPMTN
jgi:hypothetical protein